MEEKKLVPKLRFPGFTEPWEQRKLGDYLVVSYLKNFEGKYDKEDVLSVSGDYGIVNQIDFQGRSFAGKSVLNYGIVGMGDIVYTKSPLKKNPFGIIKTNKLNSGIVSTLYAIYTPKKNCNAIFVEHYFELDSRLNEYLKPLVNKGAKNDMKVSSEKALDGNIIFPAIEEQKRISAFLEFFGRYITLHQRKLEHLKLKKKSLLQKLFPKEGEVYPELRFPGFTDPWEQRKLKHVVELRGRIGFRGYTEKDIISKEQGGLLTFSPTNIIDDQITFNCKNTYITKTKYDESPEIKIINGDILFVKTGSTLGKSALVTELLEDATINPQIVLMRPNELNPEFLANMMITNDIMVQVRRSKIGGAVPTLTETNIKEFDIFIPTEKDESNRIGNIFKNINQLITLHQRKLEHLQLLKKALLQQLFV